MQQAARLSLLKPWSLTLATANVPQVTQFLSAWLPVMVAIHEVALTRPYTHRRLDLAQMLEAPNRQTAWFDDSLPSAFGLKFQHPHSHEQIALGITASFFTQVAYQPSSKNPNAWPSPAKMVITWREGITLCNLRILRF
jgi:hypothetical protein